MKEYKGIITPNQKGASGYCGYCGKPDARFIDITFMCWICDIRCSKGYWLQYLGEGQHG